MRYSVIVLISVFCINFTAKSQIERLSRKTFNTYVEKNLTDIYFCIMKRNSPEEKIENYKAYLIKAAKDTVYLYNDRILTLKKIYRKNLTDPLTPITLNVEYDNKKYVVPVEKYIEGLANNIWFIVNDTCIEDDYTLHIHSDCSVQQEIKSGRPDIYIQAHISYTSGIYLKDKLKCKKKKHYIPFW